nr:site-2 protease family protein [Paenibacillus sp. JX-17]
MSPMVDIVVNDDREYFIFLKEQNRQFRVNEITAALLNSLRDNALELQEIILYLKNKYSHYNSINISSIQAVIEKFIEDGILVRENSSDSPMEENIRKKAVQPMLKYTLKTSLPFLKVKKTNNKTTDRKGLTLIVACYFLLSLFFCMYVLKDVPAMMFHLNFLRVIPFFMLVVIIHELSHIIACKRMGGQIKEIGVGLLYYFIPVAFVTYKDTYRLTKAARARIAIAGPVSDITILNVLLLIMETQPHLTRYTFPLILVIISMQLFNMNVLLPSDLFRFLESLSGQYNIRRKSFTYLKNLLTKRTSEEKNPAVRKGHKIFYLAYSLFSVGYLLTIFLFTLRYFL